MKVDAYNPANGSLLAAGVQGVYFGNVRAGNHCDVPTVLKPTKTVETEFTAMKLYLQGDGGLTAAQFGYFVNGAFIPNVDHTNQLVNHFTVAPDVVDTSYTTVPGVVIPIVDGQPAGYIWLDIQPGPYEVGTTSSINYRFVFDYT